MFVRNQGWYSVKKRKYFVGRLFKKNFNIYYDLSLRKVKKFASLYAKVLNKKVSKQWINKDLVDKFLLLKERIIDIYLLGKYVFC